MSDYKSRYNDYPHFRPVGDGKYPDMPLDYQNNPGLQLVKASKSDCLWMGVRRFGKACFWGAVSSLLVTGDVMKAVSAGIIAGVMAGGFKVNKEIRKVQGKPSLATVWKEVWEAVRAIYDYIKARKGNDV